ncbi:MAG: efflux RND transporter permease subunit [Actinomycetaceae bacterium]|nr:efflux RND transporter permease subunit [Actinomycetaceae bacterium]
MHQLAIGSLKNRAFVALLSIVIAVLGVFSMSTLKQELIPSVELPAVNVIAISPGATSEQINERISVPIETQLQTIEEVTSTTTSSSSSFAMITVELEYGTDLARVTNKVEQAVSRSSTNFPDNTETQVISGGTSSIPLSYIAVTSDGSATETADRIRNTLIPALEKVHGIANIELLGAPEQIIRLTLDQEKIAELGIPTTAIQEALEDNGLTVPVGTLLEGDNALDVTVGKPIASIEELREMPVVASQEDIELPDGTTVPGPATVYPLSDIATVEFAEGDNSMVGRLDGQPSVALILFPTASANLVETSAEVNKVLDEIGPIIGGNTQFTMLFEQAPYITDSIAALAKEGAFGLLFAVIVILIFLTSIRSTLVTAVSIPLSLLVGFIGMLLSGYTLNMLTLAALTLTIGRVVDDSIVVIENIKRHLEYGKEKRAAIIDGVKEVASAVTASTIVSFIVFVPIGLVSGLVGELFKPFAFTVVIAMAASLFVALTIVPVLAYWFLKPSKEARLAARHGKSEEYAATAREKEERYWLTRAYRPAFNITQKHPILTVVVALAILAGTVALFPQLKINLLGSANQGMVFVTQDVRPGSTVEAQVEQAAITEDAMLGVDGVDSVATIVGASPMMGGGAGGLSYMVSVDVEADIEQLTEDIVAAAQEASGDESIKSGSMSMLGGDTIDVDITAPNPDVLAEATDVLTADLAELDVADRVENNLEALTPAIQVTVDRDAASASGLTENDIVGMIAAQMVEPEIGQITIENVDTKIYLSIDEPVASVEDLRQLQVVGQPLENFASIEEVMSIPTIVTKNSQQTATISVTPVGTGDLGAASSAVEEAVADANLPDGAVTTMGGAAQQLTDSFNKLLLAIAAAILLIYVTLVWIFKSLIQPGLLLVAIPFAAIGSFVALLVTGTALDLSAMVGLLMLTGIVVTNAVVLIDLMNQYREQGYALADAIRDGAMRRLRPIVMTALATIAAMTPMALGFSANSGFISQPLAVAVIGGLVSSTLLTLVLLPVLYRFIEGTQERRASKRAEREEAELAKLEAKLATEHNSEQEKVDTDA